MPVSRRILNWLLNPLTLRRMTMLPIHPQYVVDENQRPQAVLLPMSEWERILEELEEFDDIRAYDEAVSGPQEGVAFEQAVREIQEGRGT
jgi:hypothetical protein